MNKTCLQFYIGILTILSLTISGCDTGTSSSDAEYTISGTISVPGNTDIDSDVNEINAAPIANNTFGTAQILKKNPVIVGGYANTPQTGETGNSYDDGDVNDFYRIALTKNETVTLYIAEYGNADLDLYLYDIDETLVAPLSPPEDDAIEKVQAPLAGTYYVEVRAVSGASNYILTMGQGIAAATIMDERLAEDFMPGDIVVQFKPDAQDRLETVSRAVDDGEFMGLRTASALPHGEMVLALDPDNRQQVFRALDIPLPETNRQLFQADDPEMQLKLDTLRTIDALKKRPDVLVAEPNYMRRPMAEPNDEYYALQWHYPLIHLPQAWEVWDALEASTGTREVIVAVIDTGILSDHPDIAPDSLVDGYDFISSTKISLDGNGIDPDPEDPGDDLEGRSSFHGTHVAGTIGAATNNAIGVAGIARNISIMPLRALGNGGGLSSDIRQAIYYAAGLDNSSGTEPSRRADIINMSLGGGSRSDLDQQAIEAARDAGVIIIAAAGNFASNAPMYPAAYDGVVSVSSVGADKQLAPYSNYGSTIDIAAPGGNASRDYDGDGYLDGVWSTGGNDASGPIQMVYNLKQGTSMAAPHVAGVVALMKSIDPSLDPDRLDALIVNETDTPITEDLGSAGRDNNYGYGLIDAFKAVKTVSEALPTFLFVTPLTLNFGAANTTLTFTAENFGVDPLTVEPPAISDAEATWLVVDDAFDDDEQAGTYTVEVLRDGLADGPYATTIILESSENTVEISVSMQQGVPTGGDAGYHYVLLLDPETFRTVAQYDVSAPVNGNYPFNLKAPAGEYILFAGTDADNDYTVGDPGESAGAYISMDQPRIIRLNRDRSGYNFTTSFNLNLPTTLTGQADEYGWTMQGEEGFQINK